MRLKVGHFLKKISGTVQSSQKDIVRDLVEDALDRILCEPWTWNWLERSYSLPATVSEASGTWTYVQGNDYITLSVPLTTLNFLHTGRKFQLGTHWYRAVDIALRNTSRIYVDRPIEDTGTSTAAALILYRDELCVRSSRIRNVGTDSKPKLSRLSPGFFKERLGTAGIESYGPSEPALYQEDQPYKIPPPAFALEVTASGTAATFALGSYYYFATRYDTESGLESEPGPVTIYEATSTNWPLVVYDNSGTDQVETGTSYTLRVYRSRVNPNRESCPMYLVIERTPAPASLPKTQDRILDEQARAQVRYWHGPQSLIRLLPVPDNKIRRITVDAINSFGFRLEDEDSIDTGRKGEVNELLELYLFTRLKYTVGEGPAARSSAVAFNSQLKYLLGEDARPGQTDPGHENLNPLVPGEDPSVNWPDNMPWSGMGYQVP